MGGKSPKASAPPPVVIPEPTPLPDQAGIDEARKKKQAAAVQRSGRVSTILSDADTLGGG